MKRVITANCDQIEPTSVKEYEQAGGLRGLKKALKMTPREIIREVKQSNLRGRGGAGYPTGSKWEQLLNIKGTPKYIVANADEGEPGTFKDKLLLEKDPLRVLEGMIIAGYVFQAKKGYLYLRGEYAFLEKLLLEALAELEEAGYLGENILKTDFSFAIEIHLGAGAYICGENSALLNSLEGKIGRPRVKPPHLAEVGLYGQPTLVNNVETFACIPTIVEQGGKKYAAWGTAASGGTKLVCLSGHIARPGVYEVPFGLTLRDLIFDLGGGPRERKIKFYHLGGQSGPCGFLHQLDTPYCYQALKEVGLSVGSGAIVVLDESVCVLDYLKQVTEFFRHESCGKCTPCREGNKQLFFLLEKLTRGEGSKEDLKLIKRLSNLLRTASFCGLGRSATRALDTCWEHLETEILAHLDKHCPAGVCFAQGGRGAVDMKL
ncbi:MAG TPA: NADH-quinone oxidoreductase subunit F [Clostridia bacterium]|nr:NADH-quinone oxidoreductase subunit F [Clostridia bacterium]